MYEVDPLTGLFIRSGMYGVQDRAVLNEVLGSDCYQTRCIGTLGTEREIVVDVGAHIGSFSRLWHGRNPRAKIVCIEACPENIDLLSMNVSTFAEVIQGACHYGAELRLLNSIKKGGTATGGSAVADGDQIAIYGHEYWLDERPLKRIALEELSLDHVDILKLDCEGSEFSILQNTSILPKIKIIVGEYHGRERFLELVSKRFTPHGWDFGHMFSSGDLGIFHLRNRNYEA